MPRQIPPCWVLLSFVLFFFDFIGYLYMFPDYDYSQTRWPESAFRLHSNNIGAVLHMNHLQTRFTVCKILSSSMRFFTFCLISYHSLFIVYYLCAIALRARLPNSSQTDIEAIFCGRINPIFYKFDAFWCIFPFNCALFLFGSCPFFGKLDRNMFYSLTGSMIQMMMAAVLRSIEVFKAFNVGW